MLQQVVRSLHARNPFYLLSAVCMLTGCYALSQTMGLQPGLWEPLVSLMGVLQLYEFVLLGLAVFLVRRGGVPNDSRMALLLGVLFVSDATYLNTELATSSPWVAPWVALAHLAFLVPKLAILRDALGLTSLRTLALTVAQIGLLLYIPGAFSAVHFMDAKVHAFGLGREMLPLVIYGLWWLVGTLPILYLWADQPSQHGNNPLARSISRASLLFPFASILLHLFSLHWMYNLPIYGSYLTPLYLGIATHIAYTYAKNSTRWRPLLQWGGPAVAVLFSRVYPETIVFSLGDAFVVSPMRVALIGAAAIFWLHRSLANQRSFVWASALALSLMLSGHSFTTMVLRWANVIPENEAELGVAALVAAFALLALAVAVSLWRPHEEPRPPMRSSRQARYAE